VRIYGDERGLGQHCSFIFVALAAAPTPALHKRVHFRHGGPNGFDGYALKIGIERGIDPIGAGLIGIFGNAVLDLIVYEGEEIRPVVRAGARWRQRERRLYGFGVIGGADVAVLVHQIQHCIAACFGAGGIAERIEVAGPLNESGEERRIRQREL
jgi:hypothetical protein